MHKDKTHDDPTGPHSSHTANTVDPTVHNTSGTTTGTGGFASDHHGTGVSTGLGTSGTHGSTTHGTGLGSSTTGTHGTTTHGSDPTGPHNSHLMNKADPRVDSDRLGTAGNTAGAGGHGAGQYAPGTTGTHGTTHSSDPTGPHNSHLMNKADPRVDSDRLGTAGNTAGAGGHGAGQYAPGTTGTHGTTYGSDPTGPHNSHMMNQADPRVDSDRLGTAGNTAGAGGYGAGQYTEPHHTSGNGLTGHSTAGQGLGSSTTGVTGHNTTGHSGLGHSDPSGPHNSHMANTADPRVGGGIGSTGIGGTTGEHSKVAPGGEGGYQSKGDLPKALVEPQSHAVPHSSIRDDQHSSAHGTHGTHGTTDVHGKPSMMDKLNPKKDADHDGKAGIMD